MTKAKLALIASIALIATSADARQRHRATKPVADSRVITLLLEMKSEIASLNARIRNNDPAPVAKNSTPVTPQNRLAVASLIELPKEIAPGSRSLVPVMPATAIQRGQWNDKRKRRRHAGIDLGGVWGSEIVASFAGVVLPAPGRDRGYGPRVLVIKGDDGIVYRYAHLATVDVETGQNVLTGQRIGTMGKVGRKGFPHLHFEMMRYAEYRRRPYGVHKLDPNDYLGGGRGTRMVAGDLMQGQAATQYAAAR